MKCMLLVYVNEAAWPTLTPALQQQGMAAYNAYTDWAAIAQIYDTLSAITDSPVVAINRAVALAETGRTDAGLAALGAPLEVAPPGDVPTRLAARAQVAAPTDRMR